MENPNWDIYVAVDGDEAEKLSNQIINKKCIYMPYLGSNDHTADITDAVITDAVKIQDTDGIQINSLFPADDSVTDYDADVVGTGYRYREMLPAGLTQSSNQYETMMMEFTNYPVENTSSDIYKIGDKNIVFI